MFYVVGDLNSGAHVPVTAKLSKNFYETFGDEIANELVEWFNLVDATYRADLRELNEINFQRFDAKVEQRFAESDAKLERRLSELEGRWEGRTHELRVELLGAMANQRADLIKWMFVFWIGNVATTGALMIALVTLIR